MVIHHLQLFFSGIVTMPTCLVGTNYSASGFGPNIIVVTASHTQSYRIQFVEHNNISNESTSLFQILTSLLYLHYTDHYAYMFFLYYVGVSTTAASTSATSTTTQATSSAVQASSTGLYKSPWSISTTNS
jgi:hypothetical protein